MYLCLYKFKTRHHLFNNTRRALASSRVDLLSNQWSYQVNTGCHCYYLWDSATTDSCHGMGMTWGIPNGVFLMVLFMLMVIILTDSAGWLQLAHIPFNIQILKAQEGIIF